MHFEIVFSYIGNLLRVLVTLDLIIQQQTHLKDDWNVYKRFVFKCGYFSLLMSHFFFLFFRMVKSIHHNTAKFNNIDMNKFHRFEKQLIELEGQLLDGNIYQVCQLALY
jgi:WASH complex subunit 7